MPAMAETQSGGDLTPAQIRALNRTPAQALRHGLVQALPFMLVLVPFGMLFGDAVINSERLTVPHYDMKNRGFMLWPLYEIAPTLHFPDGTALRDVLENLGAEKPAIW